MEILSDPKAMQDLSASWHCCGQSVGFVPTMGALHAGHGELFRGARAANDKFVASIFVNPAQFGPREDLSAYPRPFERDCELLRDAGCDAIFAPDASAMYDQNSSGRGTWIDVTPFDEMWEGVTRPGHLRGVATVVAKLFNIANPTRAYFGEKDFQQLRVIQTMVHDLNFSVEIVPVPTVREADGLAMSSRNAYLAPEERAAAAAIARALNRAVALAQVGENDVAKLGEAMDEIFVSQPQIQTQYVTIVDAQTLAPLEKLDGRAARILIAARVGKTRLIDNMAV